MSTAKWLDQPLNSNRYIQTYFNGFVDISGGDFFLRGDDQSNTHCNMYINNGDISLNGRLFVSNDVSLNSRLTVYKDVSLNSRLFVGGDVSINSRLFVGSDAIIYGRLSVNEYQSNFIINTTTSNYTIIISEDMSLNGNLYVLKDASLNRRLFVGGDVSLNSRLTVYNDVSLNRRLFVGGDVSLNSRLTVYSDTSLNGLLFVGKDTSMNGNVYISGNVRIGTTNFIYGTSGQIYALDVNGTTNFRNIVNPINLIDNSVLFTNTPDFDFSSNFGILWTKNPNSIQSFWTSIAVSATGQYQIACNGLVNGDTGISNSGYLYISNNYGVTWNQLNLNITFVDGQGQINPNQNNPNVTYGPFYSVSVSSTGQYMIALLNAAAITGYASSLNNNFTYCVYTSNNYGVTWNTNNIQYKLCYASAISATGQYQIFIQNNMNDTYTSPANNIYISFDYGNTFSSYGNINSMTGVAMSATGQYVTITQSNYYNSNDKNKYYYGYIYTSNNFGVTWNQVASGTNWNNVAMSSSGQYQYASVYGGIIYFSNNYGASWVSTGSISGIWSSLSVTADGKCVVACINGGGIYTSSNYGSNWLLSNSPNNSWNSVSISSNGKYITGCASKYNINNRVADYIYNSVTPFENLSISNVLNNLNDTSLNNRLFVGGDVSMNNRLYVKNNILVGNISNIVDFSSTTLLTLSSGNPGNTGATIQLYGGGSKGSTVNINFDTYYSPTKGKIPATIIQAIDNGNLSNDLTFWTTNTGSISNTPAERMRITGNGYIGIGTTNPSYKLDICGNAIVRGPLIIQEDYPSSMSPNSGTILISKNNTGGQQSIVFQSKTNNGSDYGYISYIDDVKNNFSQYNYWPTVGQLNETSALVIGCENDHNDITGPDSVIITPVGCVAITPKSSITYISGNVGIGVTNPANKLQVEGDISGNNIYINNNAIINGYIGIGTNSPTAPLHIISNSNSKDGNSNELPYKNGVYVYNSNDNVNAIVSVRTGNGVNNGGNVSINAGNPFISWDIAGVVGWCAGIDNNDSQKFKIANSWNSLTSNTVITITRNNSDNGYGKVGIGTANPINKLHIIGADNGGNKQGHLIVDYPNSGGSGGSITLRNSSGGKGAFASLLFELDGTESTNTGNTVSTYNAANGMLYCQNLATTSTYTNNASKMAIQLWNGSNEVEVQTWLPNGNVGIGTTNPSYLLDVNGSGRFVNNILLGYSVNSPIVLSTNSENILILTAESDYGEGTYITSTSKNAGKLIDITTQSLKSKSIKIKTPDFGNSYWCYDGVLYVYAGNLYLEAANADNGGNNSTGPIQQYGGNVIITAGKSFWGSYPDSGLYPNGIQGSIIFNAGCLKSGYGVYTIERMRIVGNTGNVGIGTNAPDNNLTISTTTSGGGISIKGTNNTGISFASSGDAGTGVTRSGSILIKGADATDKALQFYNSSSDLASTNIMYNFIKIVGTTITNLMYIDYGGNMYVSNNISASGTVSAGSDYRIKTNITPIIDPSITTLVLNPVTYQRTDNDSSKREYGFIAHEVQEHYPELVTGYKDQVDASGNIITQTLNYLGIIPIAVHDIIQLNKEIQSLKQKNTELENRLALLEQRFTQAMI